MASPHPALVSTEATQQPMGNGDLPASCTNADKPAIPGNNSIEKEMHVHAVSLEDENHAELTKLSGIQSKDAMEDRVQRHSINRNRESTRLKKSSRRSRDGGSRRRSIIRSRERGYRRRSISRSRDRGSRRRSISRNRNRTTRRRSVSRSRNRYLRHEAHGRFQRRKSNSRNPEVSPSSRSSSFSASESPPAYRGSHRGHRHSQDHRYSHRQSYGRWRHRTERRRSESSSDERMVRSTNSKLAGNNVIEIGGSGPEVVAGAARNLQTKIDLSVPVDEKKEQQDEVDKTVIEEPLTYGDPRLEKLMDEEVRTRVEMEVQERVNSYLNSDEFKAQLDKKLAEEREKQTKALSMEVEIEKRRILEEFKQKEEEKKRSKEMLEDIMAENERRIKEEQQRLAEEQAKADEERLMELQKLQLAREEERRKRLMEGKDKPLNGGKKGDSQGGRQKFAFKIGRIEEL